MNAAGSSKRCFKSSNEGFRRQSPLKKTSRVFAFESVLHVHETNDIPAAFFVTYAIYK